jgi:predicted secreted protein
VYPDGKTDHHTIGLPGYKRSGIKDYRIRRVVTDESGTSLVFVIEKILVDTRGESVRFMVETLKL